MKLTLPQLPLHFSKTLGKVYLVCGDEEVLMQETLSLIRQKAATAGFTDRLRINIETDADLENSYTHAYTPPFLGQRRLLELHWKGKPSKSGQEFLQAYALHPSPYSLLLVRLAKLDSKTEQTQWFKALEKKTVVISIWPLPQTQFPSWLIQRAKAENFQLTPEAAQLLAHSVQGNLQAAAQEIEKLSLLGLPTVDRSTIEDLIVDQGCFSAFELVDQALAGNASQVLRILQYLQKEGSEPLLILGAFTFELRTVAKLANELQKGGNLSTLFTHYRIRLTKQDALRAFFRRHGESSLFNLFLKAGEIDRIAKGASNGNIWQTLEAFSLTVAGKDLGYGRADGNHI